MPTPQSSGYRATAAYALKTNLMSCWDRKCELKQNLHLQKFPSLQNTSHTSVKRALFTGCIGDTVYIVYSVYPGYTAYTAYTNFTDYIV